MELAGNCCLITGGATGIGYALAEAFLTAGSEVIICGRREERLREAQTSHPELHIMVCDVTKAAERKRLAQWATTNFPQLNILVNNAGVQRGIDFTKGIDQFLAGADEIEINLKAPICLSGLFIPHLMGKRQAAIVNVSSGLGFVPAARMPVYSATKAGLHAFSLALRHQLARTGIKLFEVVPPAVDTELNPEGRILRGHYKPDLQPAEFVAAVMEGLRKDIFEIGYGMSAQFIHASRQELDESFRQMNSQW
jgi:uncharacterized oxidoreductase